MNISGKMNTYYDDENRGPELNEDCTVLINNDGVLSAISYDDDGPQTYRVTNRNGPQLDLEKVPIGGGNGFSTMLEIKEDGEAFGIWKEGHLSGMWKVSWEEN